MNEVHTPGTRRYDLDWVRTGAFLLLILYHVGMYFVSWDWHVKSAHQITSLESWMTLVNPWRLGLLFLVSGAATRFMLERPREQGLVASRSSRLLWPLLFGMLVIVPPQSYFEVVEKAGYADGYLAFYLRYLSADQSFCRGDDCLILPTWNHLWFVAYLWVYTLLLAAFLRWRPLWLTHWQQALEPRLATIGVLLLPWAVLALARLLLVGVFDQTHALVDDWYNHAQYLVFFFFGYLFARSAPVWTAIERWRWPALAAALASFAFIAWYFGSYSEANPPPDWLRYLQRGIYALDQWGFTLAILGFGRRWLNHDNAARRYLSIAIFPFYILHQTLIILAAQYLKPLQLGAAAEASALIAMTAVGCVLGYEIARRIGWLRPVMGLKSRSAS